MNSFREYVQNHESKRGHFLDYWRSLSTKEPIYVEPITKDHQGTTKGEDTIRLSGSPKFIATVLARLKELMALENERTKLDITFRQSQYVKENGARSYILYIHAKER